MSNLIVATSRTSKRTPKILVVDDDPGLLRLLTIRLRSQKYEVEPAENAAKALSVIARFRPDLVITDLRMAEMDGIALLRELQRRWPGLNVIMLTAHGTIPDAVKATQSGAFAFLTKPVEKEQLLEEVRRALKTSGFADTAEEWRTEFATRSPLVEDRLTKAHLVAGTDSSVLITGEPGTGKELMAQGDPSGQRPPRRGRSCTSTAVPWTAAPSTWPAASRNSPVRRGGHERHDLPAQRRRPRAEPADTPGRACCAVRATCACWPPATCARTSWRPMDATPPTCWNWSAAVHIDLPPLSRRREDVPLLAAQCLEDLAVENSQPKRSLSPEAMEALASAKWPGNVRQLRMVVRQVASLGAGPVITVEQVQDAQGQATQLPSFDQARDEFTRNYLVQLLQITQGNVSQAARMAKRNRTDFYKLLTKHELKPEEFKD